MLGKLDLTGCTMHPVVAASTFNYDALYIANMSPSKFSFSFCS